MRRKISIIILTLNSVKFIRECLDSVYRQSFRDYEIILVDNNSRDETVSLVREFYPQVCIIENSVNRGACEARNQGIEKASGDFIMTLDCDVILRQDCLEKLICDSGTADFSIAVFQPEILNMDKKTINSCGIRIDKWFRFYDLGKGLNKDRYAGKQEIFGACCACAFYRKKALDTIKEQYGYFDKNFFFLAEDVDLALRLQKKGMRARYVPEAVCYHHGNSSACERQVRQYFCWRNRKILCLKNGFYDFSCFLSYDIPRAIWLFLSNHYFRRNVFSDKIKKTVQRK